MSHFDSRYDYRVLYPEDFKKDTDEIVFIGHCENDSRIDYIDFLFKKSVNLHIYGPEAWEHFFVIKNWPQGRMHARALGEEYRRIIHEASMALAFFSKANRDEYTRRCFEIPVMGTMLLAPKTSVMEEIFRDRENVRLFDTKEDLLKIINYYTSHKNERDIIAERGYNYISKGGFSEISRAQMVINDIKEWKTQ